jgi:hypothetical protein
MSRAYLVGQNLYRTLALPLGKLFDGPRALVIGGSRVGTGHKTIKLGLLSGSNVGVFSLTSANFSASTSPRTSAQHRLFNSPIACLRHGIPTGVRSHIAFLRDPTGVCEHFSTSTTAISVVIWLFPAGRKHEAHSNIFRMASGVGIRRVISVHCTKGHTTILSAA